MAGRVGELLPGFVERRDVVCRDDEAVHGGVAVERCDLELIAGGALAGCAESSFEADSTVVCARRGLGHRLEHRVAVLDVDELFERGADHVRLVMAQVAGECRRCADDHAVEIEMGEK